MDTITISNFYKAWQPLIAAIPDVIAAVEQVEEHRRHIDIVKNELADLMAQADKVKADSEGLAASAQKAYDTRIAEGEAIVADARMRAANIVSAAKATEESMKKGMDSLAAQAAEIQKKIGGLDAAYALKTQELETAHAVKTKQLESEIEELEARRNKAEKALAALKAKLEA